MATSLIRLTSRSPRARNRIAEHGAIFQIERRGTFRGATAVLCRCDGHCDWLGWFVADEATWTPIVKVTS